MGKDKRHHLLLPLDSRYEQTNRNYLIPVSDILPAAAR